MHRTQSLWSFQKLAWWCSHFHLQQLKGRLCTSTLVYGWMIWIGDTLSIKVHTANLVRKLTLNANRKTCGSHCFPLGLITVIYCICTQLTFTEAWFSVLCISAFYYKCKTNLKSTWVVLWVVFWSEMTLAYLENMSTRKFQASNWKWIIRMNKTKSVSLSKISFVWWLGTCSLNESVFLTVLITVVQYC